MWGVDGKGSNSISRSPCFVARTPSLFAMEVCPTTFLTGNWRESVIMSRKHAYTHVELPLRIGGFGRLTERTALVSRRPFVSQ